MASHSTSPNLGAIALAYVTDFIPTQGAVASAGAGISGGYNGDSPDLKIIIAFLLGLALYNATELIVLAFVTFQRYEGLYFWSLVVSAFGIVPYSLGFLIKFFQLLDVSQDVGYVAVVLLTIGWYPMVTGQSIVLWSRLHLVTNSRCVLRYTLYMIIVNGIVLHPITTVLTFGSNSKSLKPNTLQRFVHGYLIMEKIQMVGFFVQEFILSTIYIKETVRLLKLSEAVQDDVRSFDDATGLGLLKNGNVRRTMYQLLAINVLIIIMDLALLGVVFANLYIIETTLKGVVYSIKLKLEFAVLGKLVQLVRARDDSDNSFMQRNSFEHRDPSSGPTLEKINSGGTSGATGRLNRTPLSNDFGNQRLPEFIDLRRVRADVTHAEAADGDDGWETRMHKKGERWRRRARVNRGSWIEEEMDRHNIG
ncbi:hypothetical protein EJ02DRAFT_344798 [Clathrospora elynae]|uniref:DUF7703 domain-containing protein n=1 Tax=Clathrospora elynae TaxID=706981 RepID=A0A6A5SQ53_9PLEO|nr:hypothetical protein EJ02DRAFT_344798 [Clathrospora elynae]